MADVSPQVPPLMLFVEPDGGWAVATGAGLQARGWSVAWAANAATALPAARQTLPDVVVVDAGLGSDAERVVQDLRSGVSTALIPAIALVEDSVDVHLAQAGVQAVLRKPVEVDDLDAAARQALAAPVEVHAPPPSALADPDRMSLLEASGLLDGVADEVFDRLTALATRLLSAPTARVTLVTDSEQVFRSRTDRGADREPLSHSLCQWPVACGEPLVVADARTDPLLALNRAVTDLGAVAYLGAPLLVAGRALGTLCVLDDEPRIWEPDELALLDDLAGAATAEVRLRLADAGDPSGDPGAAADAVLALSTVLRRHGAALDEEGVGALGALLEHFAGRLAEDARADL